MYEGSNNISKNVEVLSKYVRIRFLDKEKNRVLLDKRVERGKEYTINIMDNKIDNPDNYLLLDHNGMAIGFKISDGEWGPDMDHKETFRRVLWEDTDVECEMMRFIGFYNNSVFSVNDKITDISEGAIGFDDVCYESDLNFSDKLAKLNCDKRVSVKYYCSRRLNNINGTFFSFKSLPGSPKIKEVQNTVFKYCRNVEHFISFLYYGYTDVIYSPKILKYFTKLKSIGCAHRYNSEARGYIFDYDATNYALFNDEILTLKNPDNSEIITIEDAMNKCLEFIFNEYTSNTVEIIGQCFKYSNNNYKNYLNIKYTGLSTLPKLNNVKIIRRLSYYINSIDTKLFELIPNLEDYTQIGTIYSNSFTPINPSILKYWTKLKRVYNIRKDFVINDEVFKHNHNLSILVGYFLNDTDTFTIDIFKNNPNITTICGIFAARSNEAITDETKINTVLKSLAKYSNIITNIDKLFNSRNILNTPEAFYELDKTKIVSCNRTFSYARKLTHIPELWDKSKYPNIIEHAEFAKECTAADNYDQVPEGWK